MHCSVWSSSSLVRELPTVTTGDIYRGQCQLEWGKGLSHAFPEYSLVSPVFSGSPRIGQGGTRLLSIRSPG